MQNEWLGPNSLPHVARAQRPLSNRMQGNGGGGRGTTAHYIRLNRQIVDCGSTGEFCELIEANAEEFNNATRRRPFASSCRAGAMACPAGSWRENCRRSKRRHFGGWTRSKHKKFQAPCIVARYRYRPRLTAARARALQEASARQDARALAHANKPELSRRLPLVARR